MNKNLWILTEERPKLEVLKTIFLKFAEEQGYSFFLDSIRILPILTDSIFTFTYEVIGFKCSKIDKVYIKSVSGYSSFVDYLIFYQIEAPNTNDVPIYAIEETKTDDKDSRNTGVYQRCSKFVYLKNYYSKTKLVMLYNLRNEQPLKPTSTSIFGTRLLLTIGVEIWGKELNQSIFTPFKSIDEVITLKNEMRKAPKGNVPILITKYKSKIEVSGRLFKSNSISHDPNIGAISIICLVLRNLGWTKEILITHHGLLQKHVGKTNKFIQIANKVKISLDGLLVPKSTINNHYWKYENEGEKLGTIFIHIVVESFTHGYSIFENHAGCEKGFFITKEGMNIPLAKYKDRNDYKSGNKESIIHIPDLILIDFDRNEIINIEGKKFKFRQKGIEELLNYSFIEDNYVLKYYEGFKIIRTLVLYGGNEESVFEIEVGFLLNENGKLILGVKAPEIFKIAIKRLLEFWE